uniref:DUF815 domain-containing protein n=1 Tax=Echinococcus granulosus TaxID=6210 RepID=A0A068WX64_ECHGR|nr:hypothetical protein EgrG_001158500 [Echinococcus granulosus]
MSAGIWLQETKKEVDSWATNNIYFAKRFRGTPLSSSSAQYLTSFNELLKRGGN